MFIFMKKKFVNMLAKNKVQYMFKKRKSIEIVKIYSLNK